MKMHIFTVTIYEDDTADNLKESMSECLQSLNVTFEIEHGVTVDETDEIKVGDMVRIVKLPPGCSDDYYLGIERKVKEFNTNDNFFSIEGSYYAFPPHTLVKVK